MYTSRYLKPTVSGHSGTTKSLTNLPGNEMAAGSSEQDIGIPVPGNPSVNKPNCIWYLIFDNFSI